MRKFILITVLTYLAGCTSSSYYYREPRQYIHPAEHNITRAYAWLKAPLDYTWNKSRGFSTDQFKHLFGEDFSFKVTDVAYEETEKTITVSFRTKEPNNIIDCGTVQTQYKGKITKPFEPAGNAGYLAVSQGIVRKVYVQASLKGEAIIRFTDGGQGSTRISSMATYRLTRDFMETKRTGMYTASYTKRNTLSTLGRHSGSGITCVSRGILEEKLLNTILAPVRGKP